MRPSGVTKTATVIAVTEVELAALVAVGSARVAVANVTVAAAAVATVDLAVAAARLVENSGLG